MKLCIFSETPMDEHYRQYNQFVVPKIVDIIFEKQYMESYQDIIFHEFGRYL